MASKLAHPSSSGDLTRFRDRIKKSPPNGTIDSAWMMENLGFTQKSNAGSFLSFLHATGFVDGNGLTARGRQLLTAEDSDDYKTANREAIDELLGKDRAASLRAQSITKTQLPGYLQQQFQVGQGVINKFFVGLRWLAVEGDDQAIIDLCPPQRRSNGSSRAPTAKRVPTRSSGVKGVSEPDGLKRERTEHADGARGGGETPTSPSLLLTSGLLHVEIDSNWKIEDVRELLRLLQLIERGELIPEDSVHGAQESHLAPIGVVDATELSAN